MSFPTQWSIIENDPDFKALPPSRQREWRDAWIAEMAERKGGSRLPKKKLEKILSELEAEAYASVPVNLWPSSLSAALYPKLSVTPSDVLSEAPGILYRYFFTLPQQAVAAYLKSPQIIRERGVLGPVKHLYEHLTEGKEEKLPGGAVAEFVTDPWSWGSIFTGGLSLLLKGKSVPQLMQLAQRYPQLSRMIYSYLDRIGGKGFATLLRPGKGPIGLEELGIHKITPEQEKIISFITKHSAFKRTFRSPKDLEEFARAYAVASPEEQKVLMQMTRDPDALLDLKEWLRIHPSARPPLAQQPPPPPPVDVKETAKRLKEAKTKAPKPPKRKPPAEKEKTAVESLHGQYANRLEDILSED